MQELDPNQPFRFWRAVGLATGAALALALILALFRPSVYLTALADSLCILALLLGMASSIPFLLDAGRGLMLSGKLVPGTEQQDNDAERHAILQEEHRKREFGMRITFALALAALIIGLASIVMSLI